MSWSRLVHDLLTTGLILAHELSSTCLFFFLTGPWLVQTWSLFVLNLFTSYLFVHNLLMTCSWLSHKLLTNFHYLFMTFSRLFTTCSWIVNSFFWLDHDLSTIFGITWSWFFYNFCMTCSWLVQSLIMICSWLVHYRFLLLHDLFMTRSWLVHNLFTIF